VSNKLSSHCAAFAGSYGFAILQMDSTPGDEDKLKNWEMISEWFAHPSSAKNELDRLVGLAIRVGDSHLSYRIVELSANDFNDPTDRYSCPLCRCYYGKDYVWGSYEKPGEEVDYFGCKLDLPRN